MAEINQILSGFSFGEIDPKLQARVDFVAYQRGVKTASNVLSIPQGGFTRRWGSDRVVTIDTTNYKNAELYSLVYDDSAVYCLLFQNNSVQIFLENTLNATVVTTYPGEIVQRLSFVQVENRLIILHQNFATAQLIRSSAAANIIAGVDNVNNYIILTVPLTIDRIYPVLFSTAGTLPVTTPQIFINTVYYARFVAANHIRIYSTPEDASADSDFYIITAIGAGVSNVLVQSVWTLSNVPFSNLPAFDFDFFPTYSAPTFTFTAGAVSGTFAVPALVTASGAIFTAAMVGGVFRGNGGISRIHQVTSPTTINVITYVDFINTAAFAGADSFLGEPAWSANRGYPSCGTFFQERLFLAGSRSIPNGLWGSTTFAVYDFNDAESLPDSAISFYPASGLSNYIKALTSSKSLLVHTNTGNYSTPLTTDLPLTPSNFSLVEQNKDGISNVIPVFIDNQIIYVDRSGNNLKSMSWDIVQSSYVNTNISLASSHLVDEPFDMAVFSEPAFTDGYYVMLVNSDGKLSIYNSLYEQDVKGWTKATTTQNIVNVIAGVDTVNNYIVITNALAVGQVFEVVFTTAGALPLTNPQITTLHTYFIRVITATNIKVYTSEVAALEDDGAFAVLAAGVGNIVIQDQLQTAPNGFYRRITSGLQHCWVLVERVINGATVIFLEELDFFFPVDAGLQINNAVATNLLGGLAYLEGQVVTTFADGVVLNTETVVGGQITVEIPVLDAIVGLPFTSLIELLPVNINMQTGPTLYQKQHIRTVYVHYFESIGMKVQTFLVPTQTTQQVVLNQPAIPSTGVLPYTLMEGWDAFEYTIQIVQDSPLPMTLLGIGYDVEA